MDGNGGATPSSRSSSAEVEAFVRRFIAVMDVVGLQVWDNPKNRQLKMETGFGIPHIKEVIRALDHKNYSDGPNADPNASRRLGEVWIFHAELMGVEVYLKLKLVVPPNGNEAVCLSFHEPERPMNRPLRRSALTRPGTTRRRG